MLKIVASSEARLGGDERDRTVDLRLAKPALSQLSYIPVQSTLQDLAAEMKMVGPSRIELPTSRLSGVRSNHLSYGPTPIKRAANAALARPLGRALRER